MVRSKKVIKYKSKVTRIFQISPSTTQANEILFTADQYLTVLAIYFHLATFFGQAQAADAEALSVLAIAKVEEGDAFPTLIVSDSEQTNDDDIMWFTATQMAFEGTSGSGMRYNMMDGKIGTKRILKKGDTIQIGSIVDQAESLLRVAGSIVIILGQK